MSTWYRVTCDCGAVIYGSPASVVTTFNTGHVELGHRVGLAEKVDLDTVVQAVMQ